MFSGIIEAPCRVLAVAVGPAGLAVEVDLAPLRVLRDGGALVALGDSVALDGACLTVSRLSADRAGFDVVPETLACTTLGRLAAGQAVNVERALRYGQRVDGHLVQGHVASTGEVLACAEGGAGERRLAVGCGGDLLRRILPKGSITVDGVSLTVAELHADRFVVALVPHTLQRTTLGGRRPGDPVNLEPDLLGSWVFRWLETARPDR